MYTQAVAKFREIGSGGIKHSGVPVFTRQWTISGSTSHSGINNRRTQTEIPSHLIHWHQQWQLQEKTPKFSLGPLLQGNNDKKKNRNHIQIYKSSANQIEAVIPNWEWHSSTSFQHVTEQDLVTEWVNMRSLCHMGWPLPWPLLSYWKGAVGLQQPQVCTVKLNKKDIDSINLPAVS